MIEHQMIFYYGLQSTPQHRRSLGVIFYQENPHSRIKGSLAIGGIEGYDCTTEGQY